EDDVALDFARPDAVGDRLLARPVLGVEAGVDDQTTRAKELGVELAEESLRVALVPAGFRREPFPVHRPALAEDRDEAVGADLPEARPVLVHPHDRDIVVSPGHRLAISQRPPSVLGYASSLLSAAMRAFSVPSVRPMLRNTLSISASSRATWRKPSAWISSGVSFVVVKRRRLYA